MRTAQPNDRGELPTLRSFSLPTNEAYKSRNMCKTSTWSVLRLFSCFPLTLAAISEGYNVLS